MSRPPTLRLLALTLAASFAGSILVTAAGVRAHEQPQGIGLAWPEAGAAPVVLTNRGLVFANDGAFSLRCNEAYGTNTAEIPHLSTDAAGALVLVTPGAALTSEDRGCSFDESSGLPDSPSLAGISVATDTPAHRILTNLVYDADSQVFASDDHGRTYRAIATAPKLSVYEYLSMSGDGKRIYAAGTRVDEVKRKLVPTWSVSSDGGRTFSTVDVELARIPLGLHPGNVDVVFARVRTSKDTELPSDQLVRSSDGGKTFTKVLEPGSAINVYAAKPDGKTVWVQTESAGLYRSRDGGTTFERVAEDMLNGGRCLYFREGTLWACANMAPNTHGIWLSDDEGDTFEKHLSFDQVTEPVSCKSDVQRLCDLPWQDWKRELLDGFGDAGVSDAGVADAGVSDAGVDAGKRNDAGTKKPDARAPDDDDDEEPAARKSADGGCSLSTPSRDLTLPLALLLLAIAARRRRPRAPARVRP